MKFGRLVVLSLAGVLSLGVPAASRAHAQAAVYGEFSGSDFHNLVSTNVFYGGSAGVLFDGPTIFKHVLVTGNLQGRFLRHSDGSTYFGRELYNGITIGPRFSVPLKHGISPYGEFMIGFARYDSGAIGGSSTDGTMEINGGVTKVLTPRWDAVAEFSYAQYYGLGGQFNPKTGSLGAIYHFSKR
jgi:hypothetical protein